MPCAALAALTGLGLGFRVQDTCLQTSCIRTSPQSLTMRMMGPGIRHCNPQHKIFTGSSVLAAMTSAMITIVAVKLLLVLKLSVNWKWQCTSYLSTGSSNAQRFCYQHGIQSEQHSQPCSKVCPPPSSWSASPATA